MEDCNYKASLKNKQYAFAVTALSFLISLTDVSL